MASEEQYRRGLADAERGDPDAFAYQHYYHYRRGYDAGLRRQRRARPRSQVQLSAWLPLLLAGLGIFAVAGLFWLLNPTATPPPPLAATTAPVVIIQTATALPTITPAPVPSATIAPPSGLAIGGRARVINIGEAGLRARRDPSLNAPVQTTFRESAVLNVLDGPIEADGYTWWRLEGPDGAGWSAQGAPGGAAWLVPEL
jgi:hypothetical protein